MRQLTEQNIRDMLYGCAVLGTGGGGDLELGLKTMEEDFKQGKELYLAEIHEIPGEAYAAVPYMCGSPASLEGGGEKYAHLPQLGYPESLLAFRTLEEYFGQKFFGVIATELGGANTAFALHTACQLGLPVIDGDPAGRSVPELQHTSFYVKNIPMAPMALATQFGDTIIIKDIVDDFRSEDIIRSLAVASGNKIGVADHALKGWQLANSLIPSTLSFALKIGETLRIAKEKGLNTAERICMAADGKILFCGTVIQASYEEKNGFIWGEMILKGTGRAEHDTYKIWYKNENLISYRNGVVDVSCPDLICVIDENGNPLTNPHGKVGQELTVFALPAPAIWRTKRGLEIFGPKSFGMDFDYIPFQGKNF